MVTTSLAIERPQRLCLHRRAPDTRAERRPYSALAPALPLSELHPPHIRPDRKVDGSSLLAGTHIGVWSNGRLALKTFPGYLEWLGGRWNKDLPPDPVPGDAGGWPLRVAPAVHVPAQGPLTHDP
jgi:hypothetical protein